MSDPVRPSPLLGNGSSSQAVDWPEDVEEILTGDLTAGASYLTPAGGAVVTGVAPCGISDRLRGMVGYTTSLGFGRKLERIVRNPRVALAYHAREHGFAADPNFVLVQGLASVDLAPSRERLEAFVPAAEHYLGEVKRGPIWDRWLQAYYADRVFVDIKVERLVSWPDLGAVGPAAVYGTPWPDAPRPQEPPAKGTGPRIDVDRAAGRLSMLPHRLLAFRGADGYPVVVPIELAGHDAEGLRLIIPKGLAPAGGRRAGLLGHAYRPQLVGLATRGFTGWLQVDEDGGAVYAPHTTVGFFAPPNKHLLLVANGALASAGLRRARRQGSLARLQELTGGPAG